MSIDAFCDSPWANSHDVYKASAFSISPAPEFSTSEVLVASMYRSVGFPSYSENVVPKAGREFDKLSSKIAKQDVAGMITAETWRTILHGVLESPKQPNQSSKRFLQLCPIVPDVALYSGSARLTSNSWNPGALIERMIQLGSANQVEAQGLWDRLFKALSVTELDDVWARWLHEEFVSRQKLEQEWDEVPLTSIIGFSDEEKTQLRYPAKQFVKDLDAIIQAKDSMTRRQWVSLLEALVRVAAVTHMLWLCRVNDRLWLATSAILGHSDVLVPASEDELRNQIVMGESSYLSFGNPAMPTIKDYISSYLVARVGINLVLWHLEKLGVKVKNLQSSQDLLCFLEDVQRYKVQLLSKNILESFFRIHDEEIKTIACKKGIGSNMVEFSRYTLGQRQTNDDAWRGYDQGYFLRKRAEAKNSPWILSLGPVAVLAMVHCCLREASGPRSVKRLSDHLAWYGIKVDLDDINASDLGKKLRMLGLVLDSPDAESGMLLIPPFGFVQTKVAN